MDILSRSLLTTVAVAWPAWAMAHGGGLDPQGCHHNRKTGEYHCHRSPPPPASSALSSHAPSVSPAVAATSGEGRGTVAFANCAAVRAAGLAPLRVGEPGYARHLDRDGDGIACESYGRRR